jgi:ClpP class serine protease
MSDIEEALVRRHKAEAARFETEALRAQAEAAQMRAALNAAGLDANQKQRIETELLALDAYNYTYRFNSEVTDASVRTCIDKLEAWRQASPDTEIVLLINTPGGDEDAARRLADALPRLAAITDLRGHCAPVGNIIFQAGSRRRIDRDAWILAGLPADWVDAREAERRGLADEIAGL